jgi:hypothetical protein
MDTLLRKPATTLKASTPPFNVREALNAPQFASDQINYNVAVFGVKMPLLVQSLFEHPEVARVGVDKSIPVADYAMDTFIQNKMPKALDLVAAAAELSLDSKDTAALAKYKEFCEEFQNLDGGSMNPDAWQNFISKHNPIGWEDNLRFDEVLVKNFGFSVEVSDQLRCMTKQVEDQGVITHVTYEQHSLRWLTKAYKAYGPVGCQTDVINLSFAMMCVEPPKEADEAQALEVFQKFKDKLCAKDLSGLWIPTHLIHDGEIDDALTWLILEYVHGLQGTKLEVVIQMPDDPSSDTVCAFLESHPTKPHTFRDKDSGNAKNFVKPWEDLARGKPKSISGKRNLSNHNFLEAQEELMRQKKRPKVEQIHPVRYQL